MIPSPPIPLVNSFAPSPLPSYSVPGQEKYTAGLAMGMFGAVGMCASLHSRFVPTTQAPRVAIVPLGREGGGSCTTPQGGERSTARRQRARGRPYTLHLAPWFQSNFKHASTNWITYFTRKIKQRNSEKKLYLCYNCLFFV